MTLQERIEAFLAGAPHAVVGASKDRAKYGNKVLRAYLQDGRRVHPINPTADAVEGLPAFADIGAVPEAVHGISVITPPAVTERIVEQAAAAGIEHVWMQPGSESDTAVARAEAAGMNVIAGGPCLLVAIGFREDDA